ncbi:MAG: CTP synthase, partial [Butyricicoccus porcorum]
QVIPHITDEIKSFIYSVGKKTSADVVITEIGGTTGDIESQPFLEAIRQVSTEVGRRNCLFIHVTLVPFISGSDEPKSKPTQHSVKELRGLGIQPDMIVCRVDQPLTDDIRHKISMFCNVQPDCVIENRTVPVLYQAPMMLEQSHFCDIVCRELVLDCRKGDMSEWYEMLDRIDSRKGSVKIGLVGKYVRLHDAYLSVAEALQHAGYENGTEVEIEWIDSEEINDSSVDKLLSGCDGIILPGGFGSRGIEGMVCAAEYCRVRKVPYFGICLGMQIAVISYARNVLGYEDANSGEFDPESQHCVIDLMESQQGVSKKGGTMRLGAYPCHIRPGTKMAEAYQQEDISERHRHRYEFNNQFRQEFESNGLTISGTSPSGELVETVEIAEHPFYVGVQFHPEFKSRPNRAHPLFKAFIAASMKRRDTTYESES